MRVRIASERDSSISLYVKCVGEKNFGKHKPVAFILPGGPGADHTAYKRYICLQDVVDLVFHDPRGCGQSDRAEVDTYNMGNYVNDVETIRNALNLDQIVLIGKSYGSMCALAYTLRYPNQVMKLVLSAGSPSNRFLELAKKNLQQIATHEQIEICEKLFAGQFESTEELRQFFELTNNLYSVKARKSEFKDDLDQKSKAFSYQVLNEGFKNRFWDFNFENELQNIKCPTLILAGRQDWISDVSLSALMAKKIPQSQLIVFDESSHALEVDVTHQYFNAIRHFLNEARDG